MDVCVCENRHILGMNAPALSALPQNVYCSRAMVLVGASDLLCCEALPCIKHEQQPHPRVCIGITMPQLHCLLACHVQENHGDVLQL